MIMIAQAISTTLTVMILALLHSGLIVLAVGGTVCNLAIFALKAGYAARTLHIVPSFRRFDRRTVRKVLSVSIWMFIINVAAKIIWSTDNLVVGSVLGAVAVARYNVALGTATAVRTLADQINSVTYVAAASLRAQDEHAGLIRLLLEATRVLASFFGACLVLFLLWAPEFYRLWLGPGFGSSATTLVLLIAGMLAGAIQVTASQILLAFERQRLIGVVAVLESAVNLSASIILANHMGIQGVALGTAVPTTITSFCFYVPYACRLLSVPPIDVLRRLIKPTLLCGVTYALVRLAAPAVRFPSLPIFCAFAVCFVGLLTLAAVLVDHEERTTYLNILRAYRGRWCRSQP
jgi:O-antigen/teichoic acid export membrane protein